MNSPFNFIRSWKPGDTRELPEPVLKRAQIEGRYDSYSRVCELDGRRWKVQGKVNQPTGRTIYTLVCVSE